MVLSMRAINSASSFRCFPLGGSLPDSRAIVPRAMSVAIWIWPDSGSMSGYRRAFTNTVSSIFFLLRVCQRYL